MDERGVLRENMSKSRVIVMSCSAYRSMCDALVEQFQSGSEIILYSMGQGYAKRLVEAIEALELPLEEAIKVYQRLAYMAGWGNIKLSILDDRHAECTVQRSAFILRRQDLRKTTCYFFSGVLATVASSLNGSKSISKELECKVGGFERCRFFMTKL